MTTITLALSADDADDLIDVLGEIDWNHHDYDLNPQLREETQAFVGRMQDQIREALRGADNGRWWAARNAEIERRRDAWIADLQEQARRLEKQP